MRTPKTSTAVVTNGAVEIAGSKPNLCKIIGNKEPIVQAMTIAEKIDTDTVSPSKTGKV